MTPTEQNKELREQVHKLFGDNQVYDGGYQSCYDGKWIDMTAEVCAVADFITADRKRVALEARIDEIKLTKDNSEESYLGEDWWADESIKDNSAHEVPLSYFENRISELKSQQEKV